MLAVSLLEKENLEKRRFIFGSAVYLEIDEQGRFVLPTNLKEYSEIADEGVFLGLGRWVELWGLEKWKKKKSDVENESSVIGEKLCITRQ